MPWCDDCDRFYTPSTLHADGTCPSGHPVASAPGEANPDERRSGAPWHFWLMVVVLAVYLGWRLVQLIVWLVGKF